MKNSREHFDKNREHLRHAPGHTKCTAMRLCMHHSSELRRKCSGRRRRTTIIPTHAGGLAWHGLASRKIGGKWAKWRLIGGQYTPMWPHSIVSSSVLLPPIHDTLVHWNIYNRPTVREIMQSRRRISTFFVSNCVDTFLHVDHEIMRYEVVNLGPLIAVSNLVHLFHVLLIEFYLFVYI